MTGLSIAIVGAGVSGLAAASFLADAGYELVIFERFEIARPLGAGLLIQPTGLAVLERLGVRIEAMLLGSRIDHLYGRAGPNDPVTFDLRYDELISDLHRLALHRASLFHLLHQAVSARGIAIRHAVEIVALDQSGTRPALVDANGLRFGPFDLIIDASGARSRLREAIGAVRISPYRYGAVWGVAQDTGFVRNALQQRYKSARTMIGVLPVGRLPDDPAPLNAFFWSMPEEKLDQWHEADLTVWRSEVASIWP
jgi:2-polyprenyl-6-methoxyphenol hydroxylase-like FAD-dependent oxidoreductase